MAERKTCVGCNFFDVSCLEEPCLHCERNNMRQQKNEDKAKVIEAIQTCVGMGHMTSQEMVFASRLKKELGLE